MIVLDASVLIALLDPDDAHHDRAALLLRSRAGGEFFASPVTLAEFLVGPTRAGVGMVGHARSTLGALDVRPVSLDESSPFELAELQVSTRLALPDCCVLHAALRSGAAVATFDTRLQRAATELGLSLA